MSLLVAYSKTITVPERTQILTKKTCTSSSDSYSSLDKALKSCKKEDPCFVLDQGCDDMGFRICNGGWTGVVDTTIKSCVFRRFGNHFDSK